MCVYINLLLTCWLSSVRVRRVFMTSSALVASIIPPLKAETPTHATEYARTCTGGHFGQNEHYDTIPLLQSSCGHFVFSVMLGCYTSCSMRPCPLLSCRLVSSLSRVWVTWTCCSTCPLLQRAVSTRPRPNIQPVLREEKETKCQTISKIGFLAF